MGFARFTPGCMPLSASRTEDTSVTDSVLSNVSFIVLDAVRSQEPSEFIANEIFV